MTCMHGLTLRVMVFCLAAIAMAVPASAQTVPKVELSGGYQFLNFSLSGANEAMPAGWYFDVAGNLTSMLGVVFQVGGNYKSFEESATIGGITATAAADLKVHDFLGGVRLNLRSCSPRVTARTSSDFTSASRSDARRGSSPAGATTLARDDTRPA
jgi:hypothetical protein